MLPRALPFLLLLAPLAAADTLHVPKDFATIQAAVDGYPGVQRDVQTYLKERIREVLTGSPTAITVRIFGEDLPVLRAKADEVKVDVDGRDVTSSFATRADGQVRGLVTGLKDGPNVVTARLGRRGRDLEQILDVGRHELERLLERDARSVPVLFQDERTSLVRPRFGVSRIERERLAEGVERALQILVDADRALAAMSRARAASCSVCTCVAVL